jgi:ribonuclease Z
MGLPSGPWLRELKRAVLGGAPDDLPFRVWWREGAAMRETHVPLGRLREQLLSVTPGQKIGYVVDTVYHAENARRIVDLIRGADVLFIEAPFLQDDVDLAARKFHLTARQAGLMAREAEVPAGGRGCVRLLSPEAGMPVPQVGREFPKQGARAPEP